MKPARFAYARPSTVAEAAEILQAQGPGAKLISGGQSLVPLMNFRLALPEVLVDVARLEEIAGIEDTEGGRLSIGANVTHHEIETWGRQDVLGSLMTHVAGYIGHLPIRHRGTIGGSLAHADPAAEWPLLAVLLDAEILAQGPEGSRSLPASDFFETLFTTKLSPEEVLTGVAFEHLPGHARTGFAEFARRAGDFALVSTAFAAEVTHNVVSEPRIALGGVAEVPVRCPTAEQTLSGAEPTVSVIRDVGEAAAAEFEPIADIHGSSGYRRDLVRALVSRMLAKEFGVDLVGG
jgi:carbon-monoxide dehydrogenase medium subunit